MINYFFNINVRGYVTSSFFFLVVIFLTACGGGGGEENPTNTSLGLNTGVLVDSAVEGVSYRTATQAGTTNSRGEFSYKDGEIITFSIGAHAFPSVGAIQMITPLTLAGSLSLTDQTVTNIARLLQSLDEDGDPQNGIKVLSNAALVATQMDFDVDPSIFETYPNVINLVANSGSINTTLVSAYEAQVHLGGTLNDAGIVTDTTTTGVCAGSVIFSGPGVIEGAHPQFFTPTECSSIGLGPTGAEVLTLAGDEITITVATISNNQIEHIYSTKKDPFSQWGVLSSTDTINSTYDGSTVTFARDTLPNPNDFHGDVIIGGSLTIDTTTPGDPGDPGDNNLINGAWASECITIGSELVSLSFRIVKSFSAASATFSEASYEYSDGNCQTFTGSSGIGTGTYQVGNAVTTTAGTQGYEFDSTFSTFSGIPFYGSLVLNGTTLYLSNHLAVDSNGDNYLIPGTPEDRVLSIDFSNPWIKQ